MLQGGKVFFQLVYVFALVCVVVVAVSFWLFVCLGVSLAFCPWFGSGCYNVCLCSLDILYYWFPWRTLLLVLGAFTGSFIFSCTVIFSHN